MKSTLATLTTCNWQPYQLMEIKKGIGVSPGVVISTAVVLDAEDLLIPKRTVPPIRSPPRSSGSTKPSLRPQHDLASSATASPPKWARKSAASSISTSACCSDKSILSQITNEIHDASTHGRICRQRRRCGATPTPLLAIKDKYLSERVKDVHDIEKRLLRC